MVIKKTIEIDYILIIHCFFSIEKQTRVQSIFISIEQNTMRYSDNIRQNMLNAIMQNKVLELSSAST